MIKLILILGILQYIFNYFFKTKSNILSCGIFGQAVKYIEDMNQANVRILGMFNESRGKNSCGITLDSEIYHGLDGEKLFTDFIKGRNLTPIKNPIMFGHTRMSSVGAINQFNSHPFGFGSNKDKSGFKMIGVHNGTLFNHADLGISHGVDTKTSYINSFKVELERTKIDSEMLLEIIYHSGNFDVLSQYNGRAALVWTDTDKPNVVYLWSGMSTPDEGQDFTKFAVEERPMIVYVEDQNSFYFSSLVESLYTIGGDITNTFQIDYNTVYAVTDGDFENAVKTKISREKCHHIENIYYPRQGNYTKQNAYVNRRHVASVENIYGLKDSKGEMNIYYDTPMLPINDYGKRIYTSHLRYYRCGHVIDGVHMFIPNYGLLKFGDSFEEAQRIYKSKVGMVFQDGDFTYPEEIESFGEIPFKTLEESPTFYYFVKGVMLKSNLDYVTLLRCPHLSNAIVSFSHMTMYPTIDYSVKYKKNTQQDIYHDGKWYAGLIDGLSFEKTYEVTFGDLKAIHVKNEFAEKVKVVGKTENKHNPVIHNAVIERINDLEEQYDIQNEITGAFVDFENKLKLQGPTMHDHDIDEDIDDHIAEAINTIIHEELVEPLTSFQNCKKALEDYKEHDNAKLAIRMIDELTLALQEFIAIV